MLYKFIQPTERITKSVIEYDEETTNGCLTLFLEEYNTINQGLQCRVLFTFEKEYTQRPKIVVSPVFTSPTSQNGKYITINLEDITTKDFIMYIEMEGFEETRLDIDFLIF